MYNDAFFKSFRLEYGNGIYDGGRHNALGPELFVDMIWLIAENKIVLYLQVTK